MNETQHYDAESDPSADSRDSYRLRDNASSSEDLSQNVNSNERSTDESDDHDPTPPTERTVTSYNASIQGGLLPK